MKSGTTATATTALDPEGVASRVASLDWASIAADLDSYGCAVMGPLLTPERCGDLAASYGTDGLFRSRVIMARHGFGTAGAFNIFLDSGE